MSRADKPPGTVVLCFYSFVNTAADAAAENRVFGILTWVPCEIVHYTATWLRKMHFHKCIFGKTSVLPPRLTPWAQKVIDSCK